MVYGLREQQPILQMVHRNGEFREAKEEANLDERISLHTNQMQLTSFFFH